MAEVHTAEEALQLQKMAIPVMLKASAGGGGKGFVRLEKAEDLVAALRQHPAAIQFLKWRYVS